MLTPNELEMLSAMSSFCVRDFLRVCQSNGYLSGEAVMRKRLQRLLKAGEIVRVGRNAYCIPQNGVGYYWHTYSDEATRVAQIMADQFPMAEFSIFELVQLNEFIRHLLAHNVLFLSVESDIAEFVFETLKSYFPGRVLLNPTVEMYHRYWYDGMIVINKLITEAPKGRQERWHTSLEKVLVDLVADPLLLGSIGDSEYPHIFEGAISKYVINKNRLQRYARRRSAASRLKAFMPTEDKIID